MTLSDPYNLDLKVMELLYMPSTYYVRAYARSVCDS